MRNSADFAPPLFFLRFLQPKAGIDKSEPIARTNSDAASLSARVEEILGNTMSHKVLATAENAPIARLAQKSAYILSGDEDVWFQTIAGEFMRIRVHARDVGGRFAIIENIAEPMAGTPMHTHREDEVFQVLDGVLTFEIEKQRIEAGAGAIIVVPGGAKHAWRNFGSKPARCIVTFAPGGIERMFTTISDVPLDELSAHAARYGTMINGPMIER